MRVTPHILLRKGDVIKMPWGTTNFVEVLWLVEGYTLVEDGNNRYVLPWGFYLNCEKYFVPLMDFDGSYFHFDDDKTCDFCQ